MISTTYASTSVLLLNDPPDWVGSVSATFEAVTQEDEGLSGRATRRPHAGSLRTRFRYSAVIEQPAAFHALLRSYQTQPVVVPLWPMATTWADRASIATVGGLRIAYRPDWSQWAIYEGTEPGWATSGDMVAPALWGRLEGRTADWLNAGVATFEVDFVEAGPAAYALTPSSVAFTAGPSLSGYATAPRLWPMALDWRDVPEGFAFRVLREYLGFGRQPLEQSYQATPRREAELRSLVTTQAQLWQLLRFAHDHAPGASFWAPTWRSAVVLTADLAGGGTSLAVESSAGISAGDYLAFVTGNTVAATARTNTVSNQTVTLTSAPGAFSKADTVVAPLVLARVDRPRISVTFLAGDCATVAVQVVEVPPEYAPAADETLGTTIGAVTTRGYLYDLSETVGGVTTTTRMTSYEANLTLSGNTYTASKIEHGGIRGSLFLDRDEVELRCEIIAGNPLVKLIAQVSEAPVRLTIRSADVSGSTASNGSVLFTGDVVSVSVRGSVITAKAVSAGTVFDRIFPRFRLQPGCNHALFSVGCGLSQAAWQFTGTVNGTPTPGYPFAMPVTGLTRTTGAMPTITAGWFAGGWIEFGSGSSTVRRSILANTAAVSGALTLTLNRDPVPFPSASAAVVIYPGCDGSRTTCADKFANFVNFGGHPYLPPANPSLVKLSQNLGGGKK